MRLQLRVVVTVFLPWIAEGNNRDLFNYGMDDTRENGARSFGQPNWDEVTCSNEDTCVSLKIPCHTELMAPVCRPAFPIDFLT